MTTMTDYDTILDTITDVGATWWNTDGTVGYRAAVTGDEWESGFDTINGCDTYGKVAWTERRRDAYQGCFSGRQDHAPRPAGFTGAAEKLSTYRGDTYWWEPYRDGTRIYNTPEDRQMVKDIVNHGTQVVTVERLERLTDSYGTTHTVVANRASVGGVEPFLNDAYLTNLIGDLLAELID